MVAHAGPRAARGRAFGSADLAKRLTDRSGPLPLYLQIATRLEDAIRAGDLLPAEFGHHCYRPDLFSFEITLVDH